MPTDKNDKFNGDCRHKYMNESGTDKGEGGKCALWAGFIVCLVISVVLVI